MQCPSCIMHDAPISNEVHLTWICPDCDGQACFYTGAAVPPLAWSTKWPCPRGYVVVHTFLIFHIA